MVAARRPGEKHKPPATVHPPARSPRPPPAMPSSPPDARQRNLDAFSAALLEQAYDRLSTVALLRRAGVGRTTSYAQFRDKEDLLAISARGMGEHMAQAALAEAGPWGFLRPFLRHVDSHRRIYSGFVGRESAPVLERHMQRLFARWLADDLVRRGRPVPDALREAALVGVLWAMLVAWIERRIQLGHEALALQAAGMLDALASR